MVQSKQFDHYMAMHELPDHPADPFLSHAHQLPPLQQRTLRPASLPSLTDSQQEGSTSPSPVDSSLVNLTQTRSEPSAPSKESTRDRRISAACSACKKRKSKCTGGPPPCKLCRIAGIECIINESLDGRRKLAAKRVQDELQHQKDLLDGILDGLRSTDPSKSDQLLHMIRSQKPLSVIMEFVQRLRQPSHSSINHDGRIPIELLIQADEVLTRQSNDHPRRGSGQYAPPSLSQFPSQSSPSSSSSFRSGTRISLDPVIDSQVARRALQALHDCSETEAMLILNDLRRCADVSDFLDYFRGHVSPRNHSGSPDGVT